MGCIYLIYISPHAILNIQQSSLIELSYRNYSAKCFYWLKSLTTAAAGPNLSQERGLLEYDRTLPMLYNTAHRIGTLPVTKTELKDDNPS